MENQILQQILNELKGINTRLDTLDSKVDNLEFSQNQIKEKIDSIKDQVSDLDSKNANNHLETSSQLNSLLEDVDYLTHKEHETQKDVYLLKRKIEVIK